MSTRPNRPQILLTALLTAAWMLLLGGAAAADERANAPQSGNGSDQGFIYLDDGSAPADLPPLFPGDRTRAPEALLSERGEDTSSFYIVEGGNAQLYSPLLRPAPLDGAAEQRAKFQFGYGRMDSGSLSPSGLGVWLSSEVMVRAPTRFGLLGEADEIIGFEERSYNVGLGVGYDGFSLGASLHQEQDDFTAAYSGFDLGLAYQGRRWFTNIQYAGYRHEPGPLFYSFLDERKLQAFEVGAGYALWTGRLTFSGRFKYFDYSNPLFPDETSGQEHVFSLGTKLNF